MPLIDLDKLRKQCQGLSDLLNQPEDFLKELYKIFAYYENLSLNTDHSKPLPTLLKNYLIPPQVMFEIKTNLQRVIIENFDSSLLLADALWQESCINTKELAAFFLSRLAEINFSQCNQKLLYWSEQSTELIENQLLIEITKSVFFQTEISKLEIILKDWLASPSIPIRKMGLNAIIGNLENKNYGIIPFIFNQTKPLIQNQENEFKTSLIEIFKRLISISENEAVFFLKEILTSTQGEEIEIFIRRLMPHFSDENSQKLQSSLKLHKQI